MPRKLAAPIAATIALASVSVPAEAKTPKTMCQRASAIRHDVIRLHGKRAPGRDICRWGMRKGGEPSKHQRARYLRALRILVTPPKYTTLVRTAVPPPQPPAGTMSPGVAAGGTLESIARCESGGNPRAVSPSGQYRGKFQFDYGSWRSVGGTGDPAAASEAEQNKRAAILYAQRGAAPWPVCGR